MRLRSFLSTLRTPSNGKLVPATETRHKSVAVKSWEFCVIVLVSVLHQPPSHNKKGLLRQICGSISLIRHPVTLSRTRKVRGGAVLRSEAMTLGTRNEFSSFHLEQKAKFERSPSGEGDQKTKWRTFLSARVFLLSLFSGDCAELITVYSSTSLSWEKKKSAANSHHGCFPFL